MDVVQDEALLKVARAVQQACVQAALDGHEQAGLAGLCGEGRWEMAIDAIQSLDVVAVVRACMSTNDPRANGAQPPHMPL